MNAEKSLRMAQLAEQAERFEDMIEFMKPIIEERSEKKQTLTSEERNLLSVAYKNVVGTRRSSWQVINSAEKTEKNEKKANWFKEFRERVQSELDKICKEVIDMLDKSLIVNIDQEREKENGDFVFYWKMKGDYYRYMAEYTNDDKSKDRSYEAYQKATDAASNAMPPAHPNRLDLALTFSVFVYEIMNNRCKACAIAKTAHDNAIADLVDLGEGDYKDSSLIIQQLRDNLTLWISEGDDTKPEEK